MQKEVAYVYEEFKVAKPDLRDWHWVSAYLSRQRKYDVVDPLQVPEGEVTHETLSRLNKRIAQLEINLDVLDRACFVVSTPGQAKIVWREIMRYRDQLKASKEFKSSILRSLK